MQSTRVVDFHFLLSPVRRAECDPSATGAEADVVTLSLIWKMMPSSRFGRRPSLLPKVLAEDWTRGDSDGTYYTKAELLKLMADTKNFKTNSEKLSESRCACTAIRLCNLQGHYDILIRGEHRAQHHHRHDTFVKMGSAWKQVASHGSEAK